ncbi:MAG: 50S ribosomal protein L10 [Candidatus Dasytiphilus stammeri]
MALKLRIKQAIIKELKEMAKKAVSVVLAENRGITVNQMNVLRKASRELGVSIHVVRNTLLRLIMKGTSFETLENLFRGPTLIALSYQYPGAAARLLQDFAKTNLTFKVKGGYFEGKLMLTEKEIDQLAQLPTYEEALGSFIRVLQEAAIGKLIRTLIAYHNQKNNMDYSNLTEIIK